jgi:hypothetical protein
MPRSVFALATDGLGLAVRVGVDDRDAGKVEDVVVGFRVGLVRVRVEVSVLLLAGKRQLRRVDDELGARERNHDAMAEVRAVTCEQQRLCHGRRDDQDVDHEERERKLLNEGVAEWRVRREVRALEHVRGAWQAVCRTHLDHASQHPVALT